MPQLSILIPYLNDNEQFELTLVSVLENRPSDCEVIVTHCGNYSDPYNLSDEVKFIEVDCEVDHLGSQLAEVLHEVSAPILHVLSCGVKVNHRWCETVVNDFDDPFVGSVCQL